MTDWLTSHPGLLPWLQYGSLAAAAVLISWAALIVAALVKVWRRGRREKAWHLRNRRRARRELNAAFTAVWGFDQAEWDAALRILKPRQVGTKPRISPDAFVLRELRLVPEREEVRLSELELA